MCVIGSDEKKILKKDSIWPLAGADLECNSISCSLMLRNCPLRENAFRSQTAAANWVNDTHTTLRSVSAKCVLSDGILHYYSAKHNRESKLVCVLFAKIKANTVSLLTRA